MTNNPDTIWRQGFWKEQYRGRKLYYVFTEYEGKPGQNQEVWKGIEYGTTIHCSEHRKLRSCVIDSDGDALYLIMSDDELRRLVACVNFCRGITTEFLEKLRPPKQQVQ